MKHLAWIDGRVVEASELRLDEPFVMQRIHTLAGRSFNVARHIEVLRHDSELLFGFATLYKASEVEQIIAELLRLSCASAMFSCPVDISLNGRGELSLTVGKPTFGRGAYHRSIRFVAQCITGNVPTTIAQTSESLAADAMANRRVRMYGADRALLLDENRYLISRPWMPVFVVYRGKIYTPTEFSSVEFEVAREAIIGAGVELYIADVSETALMNADEIFMVDIMGVTSMSSVANHSLLYMTASRVARYMSPNK